MKKLTYPLLSILAFWGCTNIEDATPSERKTFIRFFESNRSEFAVGALQVENEYIIVTNEVNGETYNTKIHKADRFGNEKLSTQVTIDSFKTTSFKIIGSTIYLAGNKVILNPSSENLFDLSVSSALVYRVPKDELNEENFDFIEIKDDAPSNKTDIFANSITVDPNDPVNVILIGSFEKAAPLARMRPFIISLTASTLDTVWTTEYDALERDYINCKSAHVTGSGNIIWASSLLREVGDLSNTFLAIPYVKPQSTFSNRDYFGETSDQKISTNDIQPGRSGYGVIGTYAKTNGTSGNMFFLKVTANGTIVEGSERFFDGESLVDKQAIDREFSLSEDSGDAITATSDGGFLLAGSMETTVNRGKGERDIVLVKLNYAGDVEWQKIMGSEGDETVSSVIETTDGHLLVAGSNNLAGLSSAFLIKMDKTGRLTN